MGDITLSRAKRLQRRQIVTLTASNAALPIPTWAQNGKGIVYVTGCGGGGGGQTVSGGGDSAAAAIRHPLIIPSGATTMGITIGAAGAGNGAGGATDIAIGGTNVLRLNGGQSGGSAQASPALWDSAGSAWRIQSYQNVTYNASFLHSFSGWTLVRGLPQNGIGAPSPFGATNSGGPSLGYGAGGGDNLAGSPGFLMLEFVEGF